MAESSLGFRHSEETRKYLSLIKKGKHLSLETKNKLSKLFQGKLNPFFGKFHTFESKIKMKLSKLGEKNPMYNKDKSLEFIYHMYKDKSRENNPQFGKKKSEETLAKLRKKVYVYDCDSKQLIKEYKGVVQAKNDLKIGFDTLTKYCNNKLPFNNLIFSFEPLDIKTLNNFNKILSKPNKIYVYNKENLATKLLYNNQSIARVKKDLHIGYDTIVKYCESKKAYKNFIFSYTPLTSSDLNYYC